MTSQWVMMLLGMPYCGTTMGNDVAKDVHYDVTMDNDVAMNLFCYVLQRSKKNSGLSIWLSSLPIATIVKHIQFRSRADEKIC